PVKVRRFGRPALGVGDFDDQSLLFLSGFQHKRILVGRDRLSAVLLSIINVQANNVMSRIVYPGGQIKAYQVGLNQADRADARAKAVLLDRFKPYAPYTTRVGLVPDPAPFVNGRFLLSSWGIGVHGAHHPNRNPVVG